MSWSCVRLSKTEVNKFLFFNHRNTQINKFTFYSIDFVEENLSTIICACTYGSSMVGYLRERNPTRSLNLICACAFLKQFRQDKLLDSSVMAWISQTTKTNGESRKPARKEAAVTKMFYKRCVNIWKDDSLSLMFRWGKIVFGRSFFVPKHFNIHRRTSSRKMCWQWLM